MAITPVNIGRAANDGTGDPIRTAFGKVNQSLTDLDLRVAAINGLDLTGGTGETLPYGSQVTISVTGDAPNKVIDIGIPAGEPGAGAPTSPDILAGARIGAVMAQLQAMGINTPPNAIWDFRRGALYVDGGYLGASPRAMITAMGGTSAFTRASAAWYFDQQGVLRQAVNNEPRIATDPITGRRGLLVEGGAGNYVPNCTMAGTVPGSPGVPGNGWSINVPAGVTRTIVGATVEAGMDILEVALSGAATSTGNLVIAPVGGVVVPTAQGAVWTGSFFVSLAAGTSPELSVAIFERVAGGGANGSSVSVFTPTAGPLWQRRYAHTRTVALANSVFVNTQLSRTMSAGETINCTLRIACPQLEQGNFATSPIVSAGAATSRLTDNIFRVSGIPGISGTSGTILAVYTALGDAIPSSTRHIGVSHATLNSSISTIYTTNTQRVYGYGIKEGTVVFNAGTTNTGGRAAAALAYDNAGFAFSTNGGAVFSTAVADGVTPMDWLRINSSNINAGLVEMLLWIPAKLTNAQLQVLSANANWN